VPFCKGADAGYVGSDQLDAGEAIVITHWTFDSPSTLSKARTGLASRTDIDVTVVHQWYTCNFESTSDHSRLLSRHGPP
jgi:hypothetical protein